MTRRSKPERRQSPVKAEGLIKPRISAYREECWTDWNDFDRKLKDIVMTLGMSTLF